MKAVYMEKPWEIKISDIPVPEPQEGEALLKIHSAGICGSDIGAFRGANNLVSYPRVIGHELAGEIVSLNSGEPKGLHVGDKVVVDPYLYCGHCYPCSIGRTNCCTNLRVLGVHVDGGMSEFFAHPVDMLVKVPDDMPWEFIPMAEPLTIALHGLHRLQVKAGEHIVIIGAGTIGLLAAISLSLISLALFGAEHFTPGLTLNLKALIFLVIITPAVFYFNKHPIIFIALGAVVGIVFQL